jgi:hypothetical protein
MSGKRIKQIDNPCQSIEVNDLAKGIYIVKIETGERITTRKIIKK